MNLYGPYDQPPQDNEQMMDQNNLHLTHYKSKLNWNCVDCFDITQCRSVKKITEIMFLV